MPEAKRSVPLHSRIFIGLLLGAIAGGLVQYLILRENAPLAADPESAAAFIENWIRPIGTVFLYLIFMIVVPLLFSALVLGVAEIGQAGRMGRVGIKSLVLTIVLSAIAVVIGLAAVNLVKPGERIPDERRSELIALHSDKGAAEKNIEAAKGLKEDPPILGIIPKNPLKEANRALEGGLIPFMFFALVFGVALAMIEPEKSAPVTAFFEGIFAATLKIIDWAMLLAPIGVFALVFTAVATLGWSVLAAVGLYAVLVLVALAFHQFVIYSLALKLIAKRNPLEFFRQIRSVMLTAFATSSSNATLPVALKSAENDVGLPRDISSFVLTVGATANQNGTALYEGITILFLAQLYGIPLDLGQQLVVMGLAIVAGIGTAGVPGGSLPFIATVLVMLNVPAEGIGIILGIDRILDMSRTVLNVSGDMTIATCVAQMEEPGYRSDIPEMAAG